MKRKIYTLLLILCTFYLFVACGDSDSADNDEKDDNKEEKNSSSVKEVEDIDLMYYEKVLNDNIAALNMHSEDSYDYAKNSALKSYIEFYQLKDELLDDNEHEDAYEDVIETLEDEFGSKYKVTYEITSVTEFDEDNKKGIVVALEDYYESVVDEEEDSLDYLEELFTEEGVSFDDFEKIKNKYENYVDTLRNLNVYTAHKLNLKITINGENAEDTFKVKNIIIANVNENYVFISSYEYEGEDMYYFGGAITPGVIVNLME